MILTSPSSLPSPADMKYSFACVTADARPHILPRYADNPLIGALRFPTDTKSLRRALTYVPTFNEQMRQLDSPTRRLALQELKRFRIALPRLCELAELVYGGMLESYVGRLPHTPASNKRLAELYAMRDSGFVPLLPENGAEFAGSMIGKGGCGKTFATDAVAALFASTPVIHHPDLATYQIPVVKLAMPFLGASRKTLGEAIIHKLNELFPDGNYSKLYLTPKANSNQLLLSAFALLQIHCVGYVLIDDSGLPATLAQSAATKKEAAEAKQTPLTTLLIAMSNQARVPVLFTGTPELKTMMGTTYSLLRRSTGSPWGPLSVEPGLRGKLSEFDQVLSILWSLQLLREPAPLTERMRRVFYILTYGIPDTMVKLFTRVQMRALHDGLETITEELIRRVAVTEMHDVVEVALAHQELERAGALDKLTRMGDLRAELVVSDEPKGEFGRPKRDVWSMEQALDRFLSPEDAVPEDGANDDVEVSAGTPGDVQEDVPPPEATESSTTAGVPATTNVQRPPSTKAARKRKKVATLVANADSKAAKETTWGEVGT